VRYWSLGGKTLAQQLSSYRLSLYEMAEQKKMAGQEEWAAALIASANRETGQGWPQSPASVAFDFPSDSEIDTMVDNLDQLLTRGPS
jgi:hypothetical protein